MKRRLVLLCVSVTVFATVMITLCISMTDKVVLTLRQIDEHGGYKEVEFAVGESLETVYRDLAENFIEYSVAEQNNVVILSCYGLEFVSYRIIVCSGRIDRIEAESEEHGRGLIIPIRNHD